jgi:spore coat polysaccharide biosynthesis protein SpsF
MADRVVVPLAVRNWSRRLPDKALVDVCGRPVLGHLIDRYRACLRVTDIVVCTTDAPEDNAIAEFVRAEGVPCYRNAKARAGDVVALLDEAIQTYAPDAAYVYRGMGDCPIFEHGALDWRIDILRHRMGDVVWTGMPDDPMPVYGSRESPWSREAWDKIAAKSEGRQREHPGAYLYDKLREFRVIYTELLRDEYYLPFRVELDTPADLAVIRAVFEALWEPGGVFTMLDALLWLDEHPEVVALNADVPTKTLTTTNWRRRGVSWACKECGAALMYAVVVRHKKLETECPRCGAKREFVEVPTFLAEHRG